MRNEGCAALAACAHAKLTGGIGCCLATSGPGATNLTTGLACAVKDDLRVLCITGLKPTSKMGHADFQDVKQSSIFHAAGVQFSMDVTCAEACLPLLRNAISTAWHDRTAAHLAIPCDVHTMEAPYLPKELDLGLRGGDLFKAVHTKTKVRPAKERFAGPSGCYFETGKKPAPDEVLTVICISPDAVV